MKQHDEDNYITVRFSDVKEFLDELTPAPAAGGDPMEVPIDCIDNVIRVTKVFTRSDTYPVQGVSVIAAILRYVRPTVQCIKLVRPCGELLGSHDGGTNEKVMQRAESVQEEIELFAKEWHLEVRAGVFE